MSRLLAAIKAVILIILYASSFALFYTDIFYLEKNHVPLVCYSLSIFLRFCFITASAWRCCTGASRADIQYSMERLFRPAPGPDLLENLLIFSLLLANFPLGLERSVENDVSDSVWPVWQQLECNTLLFRGLQALTHFYINWPPHPFTRRCMNIVTAFTVFQGVSYIILCSQTVAMLPLCVNLWQKTIVLPQPSFIDYREENYAIWVSLIIFQLCLVLLLRVFWLLRGFYSLITMGTVPTGVRSRRKFREFTHARQQPSTKQFNWNGEQEAYEDLRHRVIRVQDIEQARMENKEVLS